jgi:hypothetical protein
VKSHGESMRSVMWVVLGLWGCDGDKDDTADTATGDDFEAIRDDILLRSCAFSSCHGAGAGGFTVSEDMTRDALVGAPTALNPAVLLVVEGDPDASYLVRKLEGGPNIQGELMPPDGPPLSTEEIGRIRDWIAAGAP